VSVRGCRWSCDGLNYAEWGKGLVVDLGDPTGNPAGDELKRYGSLTIDRAGAGLFTGNAELRVLGPFSGGAEISTTADSLVYGYKDVANVGTWDDLALYSNASANFNTPSDSVAGVFCKVYVHYNLYVRSTGVAFVDGDWLDVKFIPAGNLTYRNGTAAALVNRHLMAPGDTTAQISGSFEVLITSGFNAYFNLMWRSSRANVVPGLDATDTGRGSISFRQVA